MDAPACSIRHFTEEQGEWGNGLCRPELLAASRWQRVQGVAEVLPQRRRRLESSLLHDNFDQAAIRQYRPEIIVLSTGYARVPGHGRRDHHEQGRLGRVT